MANRRYDRNAGYLALPTIPDDKSIVGAVIVMMDDAGEYSTIYVPESLDAIPAPEVQETQGPLIAQAYELANLTGLTA